MKTLDQIAIECGADKASVHPVKGHDYARHYADMFGGICFRDLKVLEVGVGSGESMRTWLEYFPNGKVFGVDLVHDTNEWNTPGKSPDPRYTFIQGDQSDPTMWQCLMADHGKDWDIFIDDGSHMIWHIIPCFKLMWPHVKPGGYYCIEDLGCGLTPGSIFLRPDFPMHLDFIKQLVDSVYRSGNDVDSVRCSDELVIIRKKP